MCQIPYHPFTAIICPALSPPDNGNVNQLGNTPGSLALYACNDNFELTGNAIFVNVDLMDNGLVKLHFVKVRRYIVQWDACMCAIIIIIISMYPLTATIGCPPLEHPANGLVTLEGNSPGSVATYSCNESHSLLGSATSQCQSNEAWSNQPPTCTKSTFSQFLRAVAV